MSKIPKSLDKHNLIDDLRNFSWEASEILVYYSKLIKNSDENKKIIKTKGDEDPVTLADLEVNELIIQKNKRKI